MKNIFSGKESIDLWDLINRGKKREAMYALGCRCQELEAVVSNLEKRISILEEKEKEHERGN